MGGRVRPPGPATPGAPEASAIFAAREEGRALGGGPGAARGCHAFCVRPACVGAGAGSPGVRAQRAALRGATSRPRARRRAAALRPAFKSLLPGARLFPAGRERRVLVCFVFTPVMEASANLTRRGGEARREPSVSGLPGSRGSRCAPALPGARPAGCGRAPRARTWTLRPW